MSHVVVCLNCERRFGINDTEAEAVRRGQARCPNCKLPLLEAHLQESSTHAPSVPAPYSGEEKAFKRQYSAQEIEELFDKGLSDGQLLYKTTTFIYQVGIVGMAILAALGVIACVVTLFVVSNLSTPALGVFAAACLLALVGLSLVAFYVGLVCLTHALRTIVHILFSNLMILERTGQ